MPSDVGAKLMSLIFPINWTHVLLIVSAFAAAGVASRERSLRSRVGLFIATFIASFVLIPVICVASLIGYVVGREWWTSANARFRLTVVAVVDGVERQGSGVWEASCPGYYFVFDDPFPPGCSISGEAIAVDLGARGDLFVTLRGLREVDHRILGPVSLLFALADRLGVRAGIGDADYPAPATLRRLKDLRASGDVPASALPLLVRFRDPKDPKSVEQVDPQHLDKAFGPGARILRVAVAVTNEPVTTGIEKILPWVATLRGKNIDGISRVAIFFDAPLSSQLETGDFQTGD